jgi:hypothetical protein
MSFPFAFAARRNAEPTAWRIEAAEFAAWPTIAAELAPAAAVVFDRETGGRTTVAGSAAVAAAAMLKSPIPPLSTKPCNRIATPRSPFGVPFPWATVNLPQVEAINKQFRTADGTLAKRCPIRLGCRKRGRNFFENFQTCRRRRHARPNGAKTAENLAKSRLAPSVNRLAANSGR